MNMQASKKCFVICPIGPENSETRRRSDQVLKHIIEPVLNEAGYKAVRADKIDKPGIITSQIIEHLINDELVLADLTERNPNVYYELAVRHTVRRPYIQIVHKDEMLPFDVAGMRTIQFDFRDLDSAAQCREEITRQIQAIEEGPDKVDTPISAAINLQSCPAPELCTSGSERNTPYVMLLGELGRRQIVQ